MDSPVADYEVTYSSSKNFEYILQDRQPQDRQPQDKKPQDKKPQDKKPQDNEGQEQRKEEPQGNEGQEQRKEEKKEERFVFPFYVSNPVYSKTSPNWSAVRTAKKQGERKATRSDAKRLEELKEIDDAIAVLQNKRLRFI